MNYDFNFNILNLSNEINLSETSNFESEIEILILDELKIPKKPDYKKTALLGRKPKIIKSAPNGKKTHDRNSTDNMLIKVNGHFISFIVEYVNAILDIFDIEEKFKKIGFKYKANMNTKIFALLKNSNIEEILKQNITSKFRNHPSDYNKKIIENIINKNPIINKLLSQKYINLFIDVYYKSKRNINLNNYGLNINIILPKNIKMYKNLLEKDDIKQCPEYIMKLNKFVKQYFLDKTNF